MVKRLADWFEKASVGCFLAGLFAQDARIAALGFGFFLVFFVVSFVLTNYLERS